MASFIIEDWMISEKNLGGLELLAFALVHSCTQNGDGCWYGGYEKLAERIGGKKRGTINAVTSLIEKGLIGKESMMVDGRQKNTLKSLVHCETIISVQKMHGSGAFDDICGAKNAPDNILYRNITFSLSKDNSKDNITNACAHTCEKSSPATSSAVEHLYSLYPSRCPIRNRSTGKSSKDKNKISSLLKTYTPEEIEKKIERYVADCVKDGTYMKNFSTFLNNLPDYEDDAPEGKVATDQGRVFSPEEFVASLKERERIAHERERENTI